MKFGKNVLRINVHKVQLMESDFQLDVIILKWRPGLHFTHENAATWRVKMNEASAGCLCSSVLLVPGLQSYFVC